MAIPKTGSGTTTMSDPDDGIGAALDGDEDRYGVLLHPGDEMAGTGAIYRFSGSDSLRWSPHAEFHDFRRCDSVLQGLG